MPLIKLTLRCDVSLEAFLLPIHCQLIRASHVTTSKFHTPSLRSLHGKAFIWLEDLDELSLDSSSSTIPELR